MIVHGGLRYMTFRGKHPVNPGPPAVLESVEAPLPFLLVTTGVERLSGSVHGPVIERWLAGDSEIRSAIKQVTRIGARGSAGLLNGDLADLAWCMNENQRLISSWGGSGDAIDKLVSDCMQSGALAAKLAGAGMGGTVITLGTDLEDLQTKLGKLGYGQFMRPQICPGITIEVKEA